MQTTIDPMIVAAAGAGGIVVIDSAALIDTPLGRELADRLRAEVDDDAAVCGVDIVGAIKKIWVGIPEHDEQRGAVAIRGLERPALERCVQRIHDARGEALDIEADGRVAIVRMGEQEPMFAAWLDATTMLMTAPPTDRAALDVLLAAVPEPAAAIAPLVARVDRGATVWAVLSAVRLEPLAPVLGSAPLGMRASLTYTNDLRATVIIGFADAAAAAQAAPMVRAWLPAVAGQVGVPPELVEAVVIETVAADLVVRLEFDAGQIAALAARLELVLQ